MKSTEDKTLEELDGECWGEPEYNSYLVVNCHRLRRVPLRDFSAGDLRLMIGQGFSLEYLIPLALGDLERDPFVEGDYYSGDLLKSVLDVRQAFWTQNPEMCSRMYLIVKSAQTQLDTLDEGEIKDEIEEKLRRFCP